MKLYWLGLTSSDVKYFSLQNGLMCFFLLIYPMPFSAKMRALL